MASIKKAVRTAPTKAPKQTAGTGKQVAAKEVRSPQAEKGWKRGSPLTAAEKETVQWARAGLEVLQSVWPVKLDPKTPMSAYQLMQSLPKEIGDAIRDRLQPVAECIAHTQVALKSYEERRNVPSDYKQPKLKGGQLMTPTAGAALRAEIEDAKRSLKPATKKALEAVAASFDKQYFGAKHYDILARPYHRETEAEGLAKLAGVAANRYPASVLLEAKAAWDAGQREVHFSQSLGDSTGGTHTVTVKAGTKGDFIRQFARSQGVFGHWEDI